MLVALGADGVVANENIWVGATDEAICAFSLGDGVWRMLYAKTLT